MNGNAALHDIRISVVHQSRKVALLYGHQERHTHCFKVRPNRHGSEQVSTELRGVLLGQPFKDGVSQTRHPFRPTKLLREAGVIVVLQRAANETTLAVLVALPLNHCVSLTVLRKPSLVLGFHSRVVVVSSHDGSPYERAL